MGGLALHLLGSKWVLPLLTVVPILMLVLLQGGFFGMATCGFGIVLCLYAAFVWFRKSRRGMLVPTQSLLWVALAIAYFLSAIVNGASLTSLSETGVWAAVAGMSLLAAAQTEEQRERSLRALMWFGVVTSVAGMLVYGGLLPLYGGMVEDRLQFTFQYANAAAAWYGALAFLCLLAPDERLRGATPLPVLALLLTESGGGLLVFVVVAVLLGLSWAKAGEWGRLLVGLLYGSFAAALFAGMQALHGAASIVVLCAALAGVTVISKYESKAARHAKAHQLSLALLGGLAVFVVAACLLLPTRVSGAFATLVERFYHMHDGLKLWMTSPLFGIGPDNWQFRYQEIQTAQYYATVVHCSYVQTLVDAGIVGFGLLAAICLTGLRNLWKSRADGWTLAKTVAVAFILAHSLLDFDLQFGSLALFAAFLLADGAMQPVMPRTCIAIKGLFGGVTCLLFCLPLCTLGFLCSSSLTALTLANAQGDYARCEQLYMGNALAQHDVAAQEAYLEALYNQGRYAEVVAVFNTVDHPSDRQTLYDVMSLYTAQDYAAAGLALVERMEAQPYNREFFRNAKALVDAYGLDASLVQRYNAAVDRANQLALEASKLLPEQQYVDAYVSVAGTPAQ